MSEVKRENFRMYGWKRRATARVGGACKTIAIQTPEIKPRENQKQKKKVVVISIFTTQRIAKTRHTTSQNRNPLSTSPLGFFTPENVSSQISSAIIFASLTPSALGSRTRCPLLICVNASKYTFANTPNPVFTSLWNGNDRLISNKSSRDCRAS